MPRLPTPGVWTGERAAARGGWPGLECKLASWAEDGRDPFHFFESRIPRKGSPSCLLPVTYSYSHPGHLCLFSSDPESLSVHTPPSLLSELKATNPPLTPPLSCSGATAVVTWGQALALQLVSQLLTCTSHLPATYSRALQRACLHFFVPPPPTQCLRR